MNKRNENANKGFSLVELIIVVAIMAVLIGILAPTYLKYVEKSRVSADQTTTDEFVRAMEILASDTDVSLNTACNKANTVYTVKSDDKGDITISVDDAKGDSLKTLFTTAGSIDTTKNYSFKSSAFKAAPVEIKLYYDDTNKNWKVERTGGSF